MKSLTVWATALAVTSLLAGCSTTGSGSGCDGWRPIRPAAADIVAASDGLVYQILAHNRHGADTCGWRA